MAVKNTNAEMNKRVNEIYSLILSRVNRTQILQYASKKWGEISDRTVDSYISKARDLIQKETAINRKDALAEHIATRNQLYQIALKKEKLQTCLQILDSTAKLQGLHEALPNAIETIYAYGGEVMFPNDSDIATEDTSEADK